MEPQTSEAPVVENPTVSQREGYLGGSDAAVILGLSPYATPFSVFLQKKGLAASRPISESLQEKFDFGHAMEPVIAEMFAKRTGTIVTRPSESTDFMRSKAYPFMGGHLDFWVTRDGEPYPYAILECKNIEFRGDEWGEPDPAGLDVSTVAIYYLCQCDHYMALTGVGFCYLTVLFGGCRLVIYPIKRSAEREAILIEAESRFWQRVVDDDPPDFSGSVDELTLALQSKYKLCYTAKEAQKAKSVIQLSGETADLLQKIKDARKRKRVADKDDRAHSQALLMLLQGATGYLQIGEEKWGSLLMQDRKNFDDFAFQMEHPELYAKYVAQKRIGPILRLTGKDSDEETNEE